jgi:hypothetical protein
MEKTPKKGQACKAARTRQQAGQPEWDWQNKTARTELREQDCQHRATKKGQPGQDRKERTAEHPEQDSRNSTARTGQLEQDSQNNSALTGQPEYNNQDRAGRQDRQNRTVSTALNDIKPSSVNSDATASKSLKRKQNVNALLSGCLILVSISWLPCPSWLSRCSVCPVPCPVLTAGLDCPVLAVLSWLAVLFWHSLLVSCPGIRAWFFCSGCRARLS